MKSKLLALLLTLMMCCSMLLLASCGGGGNTDGDGSGNVDAGDAAYSSVYDLYVAYAEANGITPESYEVWLETITGADGILGANGIALKIRINGKSNDWEISLDGGILWTSLGFKAATASIPGVVDIAFSSVEEDGKIYLVVTYWMSNSNASSSLKLEIGTVSTPDDGDDSGNEGGEDSGNEGGEDEKVAVVSVELVNGNITYKIDSAVSFSQLLIENGTFIKVSYSDGTSASVSIEPDMFVSGTDQNISVPGTYELGLKYTDDSGKEYSLTLVITSVGGNEGGDDNTGNEGEGGSGDVDPDQGLEAARAKALSEISEKWKELGEYVDLAAYKEIYGGICSGIENAKSVDEIDGFAKEFVSLYETVIGEVRALILSDMEKYWAQLAAMGDVSSYEGTYESYVSTANNAGNIVELVELAKNITDFFDEVYEALEGNAGGEIDPPVGGDLEASKNTALSDMAARWEVLADFADVEDYEAAYNNIVAKVNNASSEEELHSYIDEFNALYETIFGELKAELAIELEDVWNEFKAMGDVSAYELEYIAYYGELQTLTNMDDLIVLVDEVNGFLDEVYEALNGNEGGEDGKPKVVKVELINGTVTYEIGSGISFSELLNKNGTAISIMYSDGTGKATFVTPDMFDSGLDQNIEVPGTYEFSLIYTDENGEQYKLILVVISVDNGQGGGDIYDTIKEMVEEAWNHFYNYNNVFGYVWEETYYAKAKELIYNIECVTSIEEAEEFLNKFITECDAWANNFQPDVDEVKVQYIDINSYSAEFTQGVKAEEVIKWILNNVYATVYFTDGSSTVINLTEDMIMSELPEVLDDLDSYYEINIHVEYDYYATNCYFMVRLNPDVSDVTVIGSFKRGEGDMDYLFEFANITLYDNGIVLVESYDGDSAYFEYFTYGDELISIRVDGVEVYYSINRESGIFSDYVYSENVIGEFEVYDEGITLIFTGDYAGAGYYFVKYGAYVSEDCFDFVTIQMYLDLESGIIVFLEQEMGILEDGKTVDTLVSEERKDIYASYVINEWNNYSSSYDLSELKDSYEALLAKLYSLKYNHELDKWRNEREEFLSKLYNFVNGSDDGDETDKVYLVKAYLTGWSVSVPQYAGYSSTAEILNANGISVCYEYSDGTCYYGPITEDMVTRQVDTSVAGSYVFAIEINTEAGLFMGSVSVEVYPVETPDVPEGNLIGEFNTVDGDYLYFAFNAYSISVYDNYTVRFNGETPYEGQYLDFEYLNDNVIAVLVDGQYMMLSINYEAMTVQIYMPDASVKILGTYTMTVFGYDFLITVYDEYFFGQNITVQHGPVSVDMAATTVTTLSYLNLENNTLTVNGVVYYILEGNILSESPNGEKTVMKIELSTNDIYVGRGESLGNALFNAINTTLYVNIYYSDGSVVTAYADMSMFSDFDPDYVPASGEQVKAYFKYEADNYGYGTTVYFYGIEDGGEVEPDLDTTVYTFTESTDIFYSLVLSNSSNSGTLNTFDGGIGIYYYDFGDYFEIDAGVVTFLFACDKEDLTVFNYAPDYSTASSYYLENEDTYMLFDVLGEYYGADWYVCNYYANVSGIEAKCTIKVWLDLESSILRTADYDDVTFIINADGSLSSYGSSSGEGEEIKNFTEMAWNDFYNYVNKFGYEFENMYYDAAKEYIYRIENSYSYEEAKEYYSEFCISLKEWSVSFGGSTTPYINYIELSARSVEFVQGITSSEVLDWIVNNVIATAYYSDGSSTTISITYDMISNYLPEVLDDLTAYYEVGIYINLDGYGTNCYLQINLAPDLSDAELLGTFVRAEDDVDYFFEFAVITVYDNGLLRVEDYDGDSAYFEYYEYTDSILYLILDDANVYYSFDVETGLFTDYVPEGEVIGEYEVLDEGVTLTFIGEYTGAGNYFVLYSMSDGELYDSVTVEMYLDLESCTMIFIGQQFEIVDGKYVAALVSEERKDSARNYLVNEWNNYAPYYDLSELSERYEQLLSMLDNIKYEHELYDWYDLREQFISDMYDIVNGGVDEELMKYVEEMFNYYQNKWYDYRNMYGDIVYEYEEKFNYAIESLKCSNSFDEAKSWVVTLDEFFMMLDDKFGGMGGVYVQYVSISDQDFDVVEGTSFDEFLKMFLETVYLTVNYSDGTYENVTITYDMLNFYNGTVDTFTVGNDFSFSVNYSYSTGSSGFGIRVTVNPDMSSAELLGSFVTVDGNPDALTQSVQFDVYDNGYFVAYSVYGDTATVPYVEYSDKVMAVQAMGSVYVLYYLDVENRTFSAYVPASDVYAKYTLGVYNELELCPVITIYCERNENGDYVAVIEGWADPSMSMWVSITMFVTVDEENGIIYYAGMPMVEIDGVLMPYISEEDILDQVSYFESQWKELSSYYDTSAYVEEYKALIEALAASTNYLEYQKYNEALWELMDMIRSSSPSTDGDGSEGGNVGDGNYDDDGWTDTTEDPTAGAVALGTYKVVDNSNITSISLYDNNYAALYVYTDDTYTMYCEYEFENDNTVMLDFEGVLIVFVLTESGEACTYVGESIIITVSEKYENGDYEKLSVFGEYTGAGEYYASYEGCESGVIYLMSIVVYLDMDNMFVDLGTIILYFDENGNVIDDSSDEGDSAVDGGSDSAELPSVSIDGSYEYSYDVNYGEVANPEYSFTVNGDGTAEYIYAVNGESEELKYSYVTVE